MNKIAFASLLLIAASIALIASLDLTENSDRYEEWRDKFSVKF